MEERGQIDFCTMCRENTHYHVQTKQIKKIIRNEEFRFDIRVAVCDKCGTEMSPLGQMDRHIMEIDKQYREYKGIVSMGDIEKAMELYNIGKAPLSLALGFGEVTITRYLDGQIPSKEYSDIIRKALTSPAFMKKKLNENKDVLAPAAYNKSMEAIAQLESLFSVSNKMLRVISYVFERLEEVTPLSLQKILYFIQGTSYALNNRAMFNENCQAWVHGPVYPEVYTLFKDFRYNPIEDARFAIFAGAEDALTSEEREVIDLVVNTFGEFSGKKLEQITHKEFPWVNARAECDDTIPSTEPIQPDIIQTYYREKHAQYDFSTEAGLKNYINDILR